MDLELTGKTALITGGSKGIGRAVAMALAAEGVGLHIAARTIADLEIVGLSGVGEVVGATVSPLPELASVESVFPRDCPMRKRQSPLPSASDQTSICAVLPGIPDEEVTRKVWGNTLRPDT